MSNRIREFVDEITGKHGVEVVPKGQPSGVRKILTDYFDGGLYSIYRSDEPQLDPRLDPRLNSPAFWWVEYRMF